MSATPENPAAGPAQGPSEEELQAAHEAEMRNLRIEHLLLDHVVAMVSLGMRRTGLAPGTEGERDPAQVRLAIESIRALMPVLEQSAPDQIGQIRSALSQLQLSFVRIGGQPAGDAPSEPAAGAAAQGARSGEAPPAEPPAAKPGEPGPAQRSGRLWVPGQ